MTLASPHAPRPYHGPATVKFPTPEADRERLTLRAAYERHLLPDLLADATAGTIASYENALRHWEARTGDPPVDEVDDDTLRRLRDSLRGDGRSNQTVNKIWRHVRAVLRRIGPRGWGNPQGAGVIDHVPYLAPLRSDARRKRIVPLDHLDAVYRACRHARVSTAVDVPAPLVWRTALVLGYCFGPRTGDLFSLRWDHVDLEARTLAFVPTKTRRSKPEPLVLPLPAAAEEHLVELKRVARPRARQALLPVGRCRRLIDRQRIALWRHAAIAAGDHFEPYTFQELRRTCASAWDRVSPGLGAWVLGHAPRDVTGLHYLDVSDRLRDAAAALPVPPAFTRRL